MDTQEKTTIGFKYGIVCDTLEKQAKDQGYTLKGSLRLEKLKESLNMIYLNNLLTETQSNKAFEKLHKEVVKNLKKN